MPDSISDDFVMANGIAAFQMVVLLVRYLERIGVPKGDILELISTAEQSVTALAETKDHAALPIAADLLRKTRQQFQAMPAASH